MKKDFTALYYSKPYEKVLFIDLYTLHDHSLQPENGQSKAGQRGRARFDELVRRRITFFVYRLESHRPKRLHHPQTDADDQFRENISLVTENLKGTGYDLDQYVKAALKMLRENIIESKRIQRAGRDCQMVVYTQNFPEKFTTKNELYIWVKNGKAYMLAFSYVIADDNPAQSAGREILRTFVLK